MTISWDIPSFEGTYTNTIVLSLPGSNSAAMSFASKLMLLLMGAVNVRFDDSLKYQPLTNADCILTAAGYV